MGMQKSFQVSAFVTFEYILKSGITGSYVSTISNFLKKLHTVTRVAVPINNPTNSAQLCIFLYIYASICYVLSF